MEKLLLSPEMDFHNLFCWYVSNFLYPQVLINGAAQNHSDLLLKMLLYSATGQKVLRVFSEQVMRHRCSKQTKSIVQL